LKRRRTLSAWRYFPAAAPSKSYAFDFQGKSAELYSHGFDHYRYRLVDFCDTGATAPTPIRQQKRPSVLSRAITVRQREALLTKLINTRAAGNAIAFGRFALQNWA
jgi:hypothetical protein